MNASWEALFLFLVSGALMGGAFALVSFFLLLFGAGKILRFFCDFALCCLCSAAAFLEALAYSQGRLRFFEVFFSGLGFWAAYSVFSPVMKKSAGFLKRLLRGALSPLEKIFEKIRLRFVRGVRRKAHRHEKKRKKPKKASKNT